MRITNAHIISTYCVGGKDKIDDFLIAAYLPASPEAPQTCRVGAATFLAVWWMFLLSRFFLIMIIVNSLHNMFYDSQIEIY